MIFLPEKKKIISPFGKVISPFSDLVSVPKARHFMAQRGMMAAAGVIGGDGISYKFDGTGDYLSIPDHADWDFGVGDFTIDLWFYFNDLTQQGIIERFAGADHWEIQWLTSNEMRWRQINNGNFSFYAAFTPSTGTWYNYELTRSGNSWRQFIGGTQIGTTETSSLAVPNIAVPLTFGKDTNGSIELNGYIDEIRVSNIARHTSDFTPETSQYVSDANTKLLIHCGEVKTGTTGSGATFTDSGNTGHTVTEVGDAIEEKTIYKF